MNANERTERVESVLKDYDKSFSKGMYVMSMLSDAQESVSRGYDEMAIEIMNHVKIIIDARLSQKDSEGRML